MSNEGKLASMIQDDPSDGRYSIRSVRRVCDILDHLQRNPQGVSLVELAADLRVPKSSVFRYVATLEKCNYVTRDTQSNIIRLGTALLQRDSGRLDLLVQRAHPLLVELRDRLDETVNVAVLDGTEAVYLDVVESQLTVRLAARVGDRDTIYATAVGKVLVAALEPLVAERILVGMEMVARTPHTITEPDEFLRELKRVRRRGYALDDGENETGGRCLAVLIQARLEPVAISISAPAARFPLRMVGPWVRELSSVAAEIRGEPRMPFDRSHA